MSRQETQSYVPPPPPQEDVSSEDVDRAAREKEAALSLPLTPEEAYVMALQTQRAWVLAELNSIGAPALEANVLGQIETEFEDWIDRGNRYSILVSPDQSDASERLYQNKVTLWEKVGKIVKSPNFDEHLSHQPSYVQPLLTHLQKIDELDGYNFLKPPHDSHSKKGRH
jgi:hypothetical protein